MNAPERARRENFNYQSTTTLQRVNYAGPKWFAFITHLWYNLKVMDSIQLEVKLEEEEEDLGRKVLDSIDSWYESYDWDEAYKRMIGKYFS